MKKMSFCFKKSKLTLITIIEYNLPTQFAAIRRINYCLKNKTQKINNELVRKDGITNKRTRN